MGIVERIDVLFHAVMARFMSIPAKQRVGAGVTLAQMKTLFVLEFKQSATLSEVARTLGVSMPAASEVVDRLVRAGLVRRVQSESDRRRVVLTLRSGGRRVLGRLARSRREKFEKLAKVVGTSGTRRMVAALETLEKILAQWPRR